MINFIEGEEREELKAIQREAIKVMGNWGYWIQFMNNPELCVQPSKRHRYYESECECVACRFNLWPKER